MKLPEMPKTILIRKYENRRLYDVSNSRYVNLDEVARILQRGDDVRVVDAVSGEDITRLILTQIIVEGAKTPDSGFPLNVLRDMVIASGRASQEGAIRYTKAMLDLYKSSYQAMSPTFNPFNFMEQTSPSHAAPTREQPISEPDTNSDQAEVIVLKQRLAELERQVSALSGKRKSRKSTTKAPRSRTK